MLAYTEEPRSCTLCSLGATPALSPSRTIKMKMMMMLPDMWLSLSAPRQTKSEKGKKGEEGKDGGMPMEAIRSNKGLPARGGAWQGDNCKKKNKNKNTNKKKKKGKNDNYSNEKMAREGKTT